MLEVRDGKRPGCFRFCVSLAGQRFVYALLDILRYLIATTTLLVGLLTPAPTARVLYPGS